MTTALSSTPSPRRPTRVRHIVIATAAACILSLLVVVLRGYGVTTETIICFESAGPGPIELRLGSSSLGITPFEISASKMKQSILAAFPSSDCAKSSEVGFVFHPQPDGTTVFQLCQDGEPHLQFLEHQREVRVKVDLFKRSDSNRLRLTLKAEGDSSAAAE